MTEPVPKPEPAGQPARPPGTAGGGGGTPPVKDGFDWSDRIIIAALTALLCIAVVVFFYFVQRMGLITFPEARIEQAIQSEDFDYFGFALEYRERRLAMALTFRTFLTSFGFIVGLALAMVGGIFILRKAVVAFDANVNGNQGSANAFGVTLGTNSPGILFMLGGVGVIALTQWLAIPIGAPEIYPSTSLQKCAKNLEDRGACYLETPGVVQPQSPVFQFCLDPANSGDDRCATYLELLNEATAAQPGQAGSAPPPFGQSSR
jgi:hypothetical protein